MKKLYITNTTMNSNLCIYMGAYTNTIQHLAILASDLNQPILHLVPYLKQMHMDYKIYTNETLFLNDMVHFQPNTLLFDSDNFDLCTTLNQLTHTTPIDVICINPPISPSFELLQEDRYFVTICNPKTAQQIHIFHTNTKKNIPLLMELNHYQNISVEWL